MSHTPEFTAFTERYNRAIQAGLVAAAEVYKAAIKAKLQHGYTSGEFVTGTAAASVNSSPPFVENGVWAIRVGSNLEYTLYWELGHLNLYTGKHERVEHWRTTLEEEGTQLAIAFAEAFYAVMDEAATFRIAAAPQLGSELRAPTLPPAASEG